MARLVAESTGPRLRWLLAKVASRRHGEVSPMLPQVFHRRIALFLVGLIAPPLTGAQAQAPAALPKTHPALVLIAYDSEHGTTEQMARAAADGVRRVPGAAAVLKNAALVGKEDLAQADAIILGAPTYYANIPGRMKVILDEWAWKWKIDFTNKLGGVFSTGGGSAAGKEHVLISLLLYMLNNRMIVAGPLFEDPTGRDRWGEIGATAITGPMDPGVSPAELDTARRLGQRLAQLATCRSPAASPGLK
jgi:multimeric flavodoxin WrbA